MHKALDCDGSSMNVMKITILQEGEGEGEEEYDSEAEDEDAR